MDSLELLIQWLKDHKYCFKFCSETCSEPNTSTEFLVVFNLDEENSKKRDKREVLINSDESTIHTYRGLNTIQTRFRKDISLSDPEFFDELEEVLGYLND